MKTWKPHPLQEIILSQNAEYRLSANTAGTILFHEHFLPHTISRKEIKELFGAISSIKFETYLIYVNGGKLLPPDDLVWVERLNLRRLYQAGISHVAYVSPQNVFNSLEMQKELAPGISFSISIFKNCNDALQWLQKGLTEKKEGLDQNSGQKDFSN